MLIQFTVGNYSCFKERQTLSFLSGGRHIGRKLKLIPGGTINAHSAIGVYGEIASGKSQLLKSFNDMRSIIMNDWNETNNPNMPPLLHNVSSRLPSIFEVILQIRNTHFRYGFEVKNGKAISEWLYTRETRRELRLFYRNEYETKVHVSLGRSHYLGELMKPGYLFLPLASKFDIPKIVGVLDWFSTVQLVNEISTKPTPDILMNTSENKDWVIGADLIFNELGLSMASSFPENRIENLSEGMKALQTVVLNLLKVLNSGGLLLLDDLDTHLPYSVLKGLLNLFYNKEINTKKAQLIFTTHLPEWLHTGRWLAGQRYVIKKIQRTAMLEPWSSRARE